MTLVTANRKQVTGYQTHRLLSTILIVALSNVIGIVIAEYRSCPMDIFLLTCQASGLIRINTLY
ncbi:MAG: hypothetical protein ACM3X1_04515, partial [Ignavibacteriales bacterium]